MEQLLLLSCLGAGVSKYASHFTFIYPTYDSARGHREIFHTWLQASAVPVYKGSPDIIISNSKKINRGILKRTEALTGLGIAYNFRES